MKRLNETTRERFDTFDKLIKGFWMDEQAQDITEYTLLIAFVVFAAAALFVVSGTVMGNIWGDANGLLVQGDLQANGS